MCRMAFSWSPSVPNGFLHQIECQRLVRLRPGQRCMGVRNISPLLQEVKLRTVSLRCYLAQRAVEIMNLLPVTCHIGLIREIPLSINDGQHRIKDAPLRFASWLQKRVAKIQSVTEVTAHLIRREPLVVVLAKIGIIRVALEADIAFQSRLHQI